MTTFHFSVSYAQVAVFLSCLEQPFNNWTDRHVAQGFSWRPGSVSFRTFDDGDIEMTVLMESERRETEAAERIIRVPFHVPSGAMVEVGTILDTVQVEIPPGDYAITFEHGRSTDNKMWCILTFDSTRREPRGKIIRADPELINEGDLLMSAEPA